MYDFKPHSKKKLQLNFDWVSNNQFLENRFQFLKNLRRARFYDKVLRDFLGLWKIFSLFLETIRKTVLSSIELIFRKMTFKTSKLWRLQAYKHDLLQLRTTFSRKLILIWEVSSNLIPTFDFLRKPFEISHLFQNIIGLVVFGKMAAKISKSLLNVIISILGTQLKTNIINFLQCNPLLVARDASLQVKATISSCYFVTNPL